ncbi:hypothetical protein [Mesorhizobium cantuariense]|uniref:Uncharacterized protein n=1 Tax=Mesorhizobium cantuariense TaxID=1300275 RepID=A0ABV7MQQ4_9HYPH
MSIQKGDYRTNRADYAIAAMHGGPTAEDSDRDEILARRKKSLWLKDRRSAKSAENPMDSSPLPRRIPRG